MSLMTYCSQRELATPCRRELESECTPTLHTSKSVFQKVDIATLTLINYQASKCIPENDKANITKLHAEFPRDS
jgi:hypothetical protein